MKNKIIDFEHRVNEMEERADRFAKNTLFNPTEYKKFTDRRDFSLEAIEKFADKCGVRSYIVIGRLMKEQYIVGIVTTKNEINRCGQIRVDF